MTGNVCHIRPVAPQDRDDWLAMRTALWPDSAAADVDLFLREGAFASFSQFAVFVAELEGALVGFAEASARNYAEGCETSPVGYLEGWYVAPDERCRGIGAALVTACENWAREKNMTEFASDADIQNAVSIAAHKRLGFAEADRIVTFAKKL